MPTLTTILWLLMLGAGFATVYIYYTRRFIGGFVRELIETEAFSPATAKKPCDLECKFGALLKFSLRRGTMLAETVKGTENSGFYIAEEKLKMAKNKYRDEKTTIFIVMIILVILAIATLGATYVFPQLAENLQSGISAIFGAASQSA